MKIQPFFFVYLVPLLRPWGWYMVIDFTIYFSLEMLKTINGLVFFKKKLKLLMDDA